MHIAVDRWYAVLPSAELPSGKPIGARRFGLPFVFWRDASGRPGAAVDICPHRGVALSTGRVVDGCVECPFHGFRFHTEGHCTEIPAHPDRTIPKAMALGSLPVRDAHGFIWAWTGASPPPDTPIPFFDFQGLDDSGSRFSIDVATHYTRAIENQLDFAHLAFVHRRTIGRGLPAETDVHLHTAGDQITAHMDGMLEDSLQFIGPNIWRLQTGPVWQFLAFTPVDRHTTRVYLRTYQPWLSAGPLSWLAGAVARILNARVFREDQAVVETHPEGETRLRMGEVLVPSDSAIIAFRRWREDLRGELPVAIPKVGRALATA